MPRMTNTQWLDGRMRELEARVARLEALLLKQQPAEQERARPLPPRWEPNEEDLTWAKEKYADVDEPAERQNFKDYYRSRGDTRRDWDAAYRNWIAKARQFAKARPPVLQGGSDSRAARIDKANNDTADRVARQLAAFRRD